MDREDVEKIAMSVEKHIQWAYHGGEFFPKRMLLDQILAFIPDEPKPVNSILRKKVEELESLIKPEYRRDNPDLPKPEVCPECGDSGFSPISRGDCKRCQGTGTKPDEEVARIWNEDFTIGIATGANKPDESRLVEKCMPLLQRFEEVEKQVFYPIPAPENFSATIRIYASTMAREAIKKTMRITNCKGTGTKPDKSGLLTDEGIGDNLDLEIDGRYPRSDGSITYTISVDKLLKAQRDLTASIKDAKCQASIDRLKAKAIPTHGGNMLILVEDWETFTKKEMPELT